MRHRHPRGGGCLWALLQPRTAPRRCLSPGSAKPPLQFLRSFGGCLGNFSSHAHWVWTWGSFVREGWLKQGYKQGCRHGKEQHRQAVGWPAERWAERETHTPGCHGPGVLEAGGQLGDSIPKSLLGSQGSATTLRRAASYPGGTTERTQGESPALRCGAGHLARCLSFPARLSCIDQQVSRHRLVQHEGQWDLAQIKPGLSPGQHPAPGELSPLPPSPVGTFFINASL